MAQTERAPAPREPKVLSGVEGRPLRIMVRISPEVRSWLHTLLSAEQAKAGEDLVAMDDILVRVIADSLEFIRPFPRGSIAEAAAKHGPRLGDRYETLHGDPVIPYLKEIQAETQSIVNVGQIASFLIWIAYQADVEEEKQQKTKKSTEAEKKTAVNRLPFLDIPRDTTDSRPAVSLPQQTNPPQNPENDAKNQDHEFGPSSVWFEPTPPESTDESASRTIPVKKLSVDARERAEQRKTALAIYPEANPLMSTPEIKEAIDKLGLSRSQLGKLLDVSKGAIWKARTKDRYSDDAKLWWTVVLRKLEKGEELSPELLALKRRQ